MSDETPSDEYLTLARPEIFRLKEKGSVFIAHVYPIRSAEDADKLLLNLRRQYHDATHIGWARRIAPPPDGEERWSDDGEPSGSTGRPILDTIRGAELWSVLVAVVRYFGGTKLGVGGLARAYGGAAASALAAAPKQTVVRTRTLRVELPHDRAGAVYAVCDRFQVHRDAPEYTERGLILALVVPLSRVKAVTSAVLEVTAGRARVHDA